MRATQREAAVERAWPNLTTWVNDAREKTRTALGLSKVVSDRAATQLVEGLLRNRCATVAADDFKAQIGASFVSTYPGSPAFARVRCSHPLPPPELSVDVLQEIAWGSDLHRVEIEAWVGSAVRTEAAFVWHQLNPLPKPLLSAQHLVPHASLHEMLVLDPPWVWTDWAAVLELEWTARTLDEAALTEARAALGATEDQALWVVVSGVRPTLDAKAEAALFGGTVMSLPPPLSLEGYAIVAAIGSLDATLLRGTTLDLGWDDTGDGIELVLEHLIAVEVVRQPQAVIFPIV